MSLIDIANELEYVPQEQLIQMTQNPDSRFPQYLVLSEIQRRNQMRRMYENQVNQMQMPQSTVAEEATMELAQSGLPGAMPNVVEPNILGETNTQRFENSGGLAPVRMQSGGSTSRPQPWEPGYDEYLMQERQDLYPNTGGAERALDYIKENPIEAGLLALSLNPFGRIAVGGGKLGMSLLRTPFLQRQATRLANLFRRPNPSRMLPGGGLMLGRGAYLPKYRNIGIAGLLGGLGLQTLYDDNQLSGDILSSSIPSEDESLTSRQQIEEISQDIPESNLSFGDPLDLARIGFAVAGAKSPRELSSSLGALASDIQERRRTDRSLQLSEELQQAQLDLAKENLAYLPTDRLAQQANLIIQTIEALNQSVREGTYMPDEAQPRLEQLYSSLNNLYASAFGIDMNTMNSGIDLENFIE